QNCMAQAGTRHLMLGRGAVTRPDLVAQIDREHSQISNVQTTLLWQ
ncbi:MAG TPA: tRNA dihydrouridine(16) synthase DusC, partial [Psychrobacter sp.]|nr:tRNA dihydrouridine(16) synthase DusC [Psychrobacter sp.]